VAFTMTNLPFTDPGVSCEITLTGADGYTVVGSANSGADAESCAFDVDNFDPDGMNECMFVATPGPTVLTVNTDFDWMPDNIPESDVDTSFVTVLTCTNVSPTTGPNFGTYMVSTTALLLSTTWYAAPGETPECTVELIPQTSAVESDECEFTFVVNDEEAGCDVVGTIFFEGIPTLSQYGMALMALLMLGLGFIGMRRFV